MPDFDFTFDLASIASAGIRAGLILAVAVAARIVAGKMITRAVHARIPRVFDESREQLALRSDTVAGALNRAVGFAIWTVAGVTLLAEAGVNVGALIATIGIASIAVGFASQLVIRDYLHGFLIIMEDWYRVGEVASVAGTAGLVVDINPRRTVLRDLNGAVHHIPNSKIDMASNLTREFARLNLNVQVAYGEDLDRVIEVINDECAKLKEDETWGPDLITQPEVLRVDNFAESGIEIKILGDTKPIRQWALTGELRLRLKRRFDREGIEIPWPHTKVYFGDGDPRKRAAA